MRDSRTKHEAFLQGGVLGSNMKAERASLAGDERLFPHRDAGQFEARGATLRAFVPDRVRGAQFKANLAGAAGSLPHQKGERLGIFSMAWRFFGGIFAAFSSGLSFAFSAVLLAELITHTAVSAIAAPAALVLIGFLATFLLLRFAYHWDHELRHEKKVPFRFFGREPH